MKITIGQTFLQLSVTKKNWKDWTDLSFKSAVMSPVKALLTKNKVLDIFTRIV